MKTRFFPLLFGSFTLVTLMALVLAAPARAFDSRSGESILIPAGEVIEDDLYLFGNTITIDGTVKGDVIAFGSTITIGQTGVVEGDLMGAGQSVIVNGQVQDDARIAGAVLLLDSSRTGVLPLAGRNFHFKPLASGGDYESGELIGEYTLEMKNEAAHGIIRGLATS